LLEVRVSSERAIVDVIARVKDVLRMVVSAPGGDEASPLFGSIELPEWFEAACAPEPIAEDEAKWLEWWRALEPEARARAAAEKPWTVADWLHWMQPGERQWFWWDARIDAPHEAIIRLEIHGWPTATGALLWLLRVAGASAVEVVEGGGLT
jgi:hypothetical protein